MDQFTRACPGFSPGGIRTADGAAGAPDEAADRSDPMRKAERASARLEAKNSPSPGKSEKVRTQRLGRGRSRLTLSTTGIVFLYLVIFHIVAGLWLVFNPIKVPAPAENFQSDYNTN